MNYPRNLRNGVISLVLLAVAPFSFAEDNPIQVESLSAPDEEFKQPREQEFLPPVVEDTRPETAGSGSMEAHYQLQVLQQEVMQLRGQVEELQFQMNRMRTTQEDRYLELDRRFQNLVNSSRPAMPVAPVDQTAGSAATSKPDNGSAKTPTGDEKGLYDNALELIRNRQYDMAISQLQSVITQYPDGIYTPNAYYWKGEVFMAKPEPNYEEARQAFAQVISFFPDHQKVPDAAFKLGKVYHLTGDCDRAKDLLNQVIEQNQGRSVGKLAQSYLRDKVNCE